MRIKIFSLLAVAILVSFASIILNNASFFAKDSISFLAKAKSAEAVTPTNGLVAYWNFDTPPNDSTKSDYGNSNPQITTQKRGNPKIVGGVRAKGISFNGFEDFLFAQSNSLDILSPQNVTAATWFRLDTTKRPMHLFNKIRNSAEDDGGYALQYVPGGMKASIRLSAANKQVTVSGDANLKEGRWYHAAMVFNGKTLGLYLNGKSIGSLTLPEKDTIEQTDKNLFIGASRSIYNNDKYRFFGDIDELKIYNRALSQSEITALYESSDTEPPTIDFRTAEMSDIFSGTEKIPVVAKDNAQVASLELYLDGVNIRDKNNIVDDNLRDSFSWDSTTVRDGRHKVEVVAQDIVGNMTTATVRVSVVNTPELAVNIADPISNTMVLPTTTPLPGVNAGAIKISAVKGEYEPASFILRSDTASFDNISVVPSPLLMARSSVINIPAKEVDVKIVKVWYQGEGAWMNYRDHSMLAKDQILVPELLLNDDALIVTKKDGKKNMVRISNPGEPLKYFWVNREGLAEPHNPYTIEEFPVKDSPTFVPFDLPQNTTKQIWLTVHVPENTEPGVYRGSIALSSNGTLLRKVPLELTVLPFTFSGRQPFSGLYYVGKLNPTANCICYFAKNEEQMRAELVNFKKHGIENPTIAQSPKHRLFDSELALRKELGMNNGPLYDIYPLHVMFRGAVPMGNKRDNDTMSDEEIKKAIDGAIDNAKKQLPEIVRNVKSYGFSDLYLYGIDEEKERRILKEEARLWNVVNSLGGKTFVAGYDKVYDFTGGVLDLLIHPHRPQQEYAAKWHSSGKKIFSYSNPQVGPENPFLFRRNYGVVLWAAKYDGAMTFAYQGTRIPWNDLEEGSTSVPGRRDYGFAYPTANGVIDTMAWEAYREAHDDFKYLRTLENLINENDSSTNASKRDAAEKARAFIQSLRNDVTKKAGTGTLTANFDIDLNAMREQVIAHILAITE